jgi:methyl acetate hydrolase
VSRLEVRRPGRVERLEEVLAEVVGSGRLPGAVGIVADADGPIYQAAYGFRDRTAGEAMTVDSVFRIASMTKLATSIAALQLVEAGRLDLDAPVVDVVASFGQLQVLDGFDGDQPRLRPPRSPATVRQLFSHTSGLAYDTWHEGLFRYRQLTGAPNINTGLLASLRVPLVVDPGTAFAYGTSTDWLGLVVEAVGGQPLEAYWAEHLFGPLGMADTTATPSVEQRARAARVHVRADDGTWSSTSIDNATDVEFCAGGHALYSTPGDYLRLQELLLRGGAVGTTRILEATTVEEMFENQIGGIDVPRFESYIPGLSDSFDLGPGHKWGLGLLLNQRAEPGLRSSGSGGWAGVFNTFFWVDRNNGVAGALYTQTLPFYDADVVACYRQFERAVYA